MFKPVGPIALTFKVQPAVEERIFKYNLRVILILIPTYTH